jgi:hypothetical protein
LIRDVSRSGVVEKALVGTWDDELVKIWNSPLFLRGLWSSYGFYTRHLLFTNSLFNWRLGNLATTRILISTCCFQWQRECSRFNRKTTRAAVLSYKHWQISLVAFESGKSVILTIFLVDLSCSRCHWKQEEKHS